MIRLAAALVCFASPAAALSCLPYWVQDTWQEADAAEDRYIVVAGEFEMDHVETRPRGGRAAYLEVVLPETTTVQATFSGLQLSGGGFSKPIVGDTDVTLNCVAEWCGGVPDGPWIAFLRDDGQGSYATQSGPCGGFIYADRPQTRAMIRACATGGTCVSAADGMGN